MARRGKTKLGGSSSQGAVAASAEGQKGVRVARDKLAQQKAHGNDRLASSIASAGREYQRGEDVKADRSLKRDIATGQQAGQRDALDLKAASEGIERQGGAENPLLDQDPRQAALQAEMQKGQENLKEQTGKPLEMGRGGAFRPGEELQQSRQAEAGIKKQKAEAYSAQVATSARRAQMAEDKEAYKRESTSLAAPLKRKAKKFEAFINGGEPDWEALSQATKDSPDPSIRQAIASKDRNDPRVKQFMQAEMDKDAIKYIAELGDIPSDDDGVSMVDMSSPMMQKFQANTGYVANALKMVPSVFLSSIDSVQKKNRFTRRMAAFFMQTGKPVPGSQQGDPQAGGQIGMPASTGGGIAAAAGAQPEEDGESFYPHSRGDLADLQRGKNSQLGGVETDETGAVSGKNYRYDVGRDAEGNRATPPIRQDDSPEARAARERGRLQRK